MAQVQPHITPLGAIRNNRKSNYNKDLKKKNQVRE
jgi:hypothetical protein